MNHNHMKRLVLSALFLSLSYVLPFLTGNIPQVGSMLLPMHIPVLLCGFLCGAPWGFGVGIIAPVMRSLLTGGFPPMFPTAIAMSAELATYGLISGLLSRHLPRKPAGTYAALVCAMVCGRVVWGIVTALLLINGDGFSFAAFVAGAFTNAVPGIILQLVIIPPIVLALSRAGRSQANV